MRHVILPPLMRGLAAPAAAQEEGEGLRDGMELLGEGTRMILEGLMEEMAPMLEEVRPFFEEELVPMLERMGALVDDLSHYELPERLPNGDIILRRSEDAPPLEPAPEVGEDGAVEL